MTGANFRHPPRGCGTDAGRPVTEAGHLAWWKPFLVVAGLFAGLLVVAGRVEGVAVIVGVVVSSRCRGSRSSACDAEAPVATANAGRSAAHPSLQIDGQRSRSRLVPSYIFNISMIFGSLSPRRVYRSGFIENCCAITAAVGRSAKSCSLLSSRFEIVIDG